MISVYLNDIIVLLLAALVMVPFFQAIGLGTVPGFLVAGIVVGPGVLGLIDNVTAIGHFAEIGVVLLLFVIGIELKPSRLWLMRRLVFGLGTLQVMLTGLILTAVLYWGAGISGRAAILIGPALALSSTAFVLQLLMERKALHSESGRMAFSVLLMQDLAVVPLLVLIPLLVAPELNVGKDVGLALLESLLILALVIVAGRFFLHPILHRVARSGSPEVFTTTAILIVMGAALATEHVGLSMAMGAFLAGLMISDSSYRHQIMAEIQPFRGFLLGLFFMSMGMSLSITVFLQQPMTALLWVSGLIVVKVIVLWPLGWLFGGSVRMALAVALLLGQSGEFALVLFALGHQSGLLGDHLFQLLLLEVLLTMLLTPGLAWVSDKLQHKKTVTPIATEKQTDSAAVVIVGFGRVGRRIGHILNLAKQPFVAFESNVALVEAARLQGLPVFFGDVGQPGVLRVAGIADARLVVITVNDPVLAENLVIELRQSHGDITILARAHGLQECLELQQMGASHVVSENVEASIELARMTLMEMGIEESEKLVSDFRRAYYREIIRIRED